MDMLAGMFDDGDDQYDAAEAEAQGGLPAYCTARATHCAYDLELPPIERQDSNFVGLWNQGATCYLNSLFQTLFMTPQFREFIFQLPLSEPEDPADRWQIAPKKFKVLKAIQDLFGMMQSNNIRATSTKLLT